MTSKDLGLVTAYAYAVSQGYTGTEEEFAELMASYATVAEEAAESAAEAAASATAAGTSETNAAASAASATQSATAAGQSASSASGSAVQAQASATAAGQSATQAAGSATAAGQSATAAAGSASQAAASETAAGASATAAAGSATSASGSATAAAGSATEADASADRAQEILDSIPEDYSELSEDVSDLKSAINNFPFTANSAMKRTAHNDGAMDGTVVKDLYIYCDIDNYQTLYVSNLFQNNTKQEIVIKTADGTNFARYQKVAPPTAATEVCDLYRYNSAGTSVTTTVCGRMVVDWSKIDASRVSCALGDFNILDCCILRKKDLVSPVTGIANGLIQEKALNFPFTKNSTMTSSSGSVDNLAIKNLYIVDKTGGTQLIYLYNCFQGSTKKEIQFNFADGTPYCGAKETVDLEKYTQTMDLFQYSRGTNLSNEKVGTITIDWATNPYVVGGTLGQFNLLDCCVFRSAYSNGVNTWLPKSTFYISNTQQRIYFNEVFRTFNSGYMSVSVSGATYPEVTYTDRYIEFNVTTSKTIMVTLTWYEKGSAVTSKTISVVCNINAVSTTKLLCIGDSWTYDGYMQGWVADNNLNVTLYGDIVPSSGYRSEGRYGWSVDDYFANTTKNGQTNTFYNPTTQTFDFSYYMANHPDYNDVTAVNIFLGMNNAFDTSKISLLLQMAESVKAYNSNIIVTIMGAPQLAEDNSGAGRYLQNVHTMNKQFFDYNVAFFGTEVPTGVYFILPSANLDSIYDFETETVDSSIVNDKQVTLYTNNVHPSTAGYKKMGIGLSSFLRNIVS